MSKLSEDKRELLAYIDAILTMIEKYPTFSLGNMFSDINVGVGVNPFDFLLSITSPFIFPPKHIVYSHHQKWLIGL